MSLFSWLSPGRKRKPEALPSVMPSSGLSRLESTKPFHAARPNGQAQPANRKHERLVRREQLYGIVREAMVRASLLSSTYKFKVLSLDPHGRQFLVMIDMSHEAASDTTRLAEIETMIAQSAKSRFDIYVSAVYWRANDHVAVGDPMHPMQKVSVSRPAPLMPERPLPGRTVAQEPVPSLESLSVSLSEEITHPAELRAAPPEPLQAEEVAAFKKALSTGLRGEQALAKVSPGKVAHSYTLLTGFEDTEMASDAQAEQLSATQYGMLR